MSEFMDKNLKKKTWSSGDHFSMADCSAAPSLGYCQELHPYEKYKNIKSYWNRLCERESFMKVMEEALPFMEKWKKSAQREREREEKEREKAREKEGGESGRKLRRR